MIRHNPKLWAYVQSLYMIRTGVRKGIASEEMISMIDRRELSRRKPNPIPRRIREYPIHELETGESIFLERSLLLPITTTNAILMAGRYNKEYPGMFEWGKHRSAIPKGFDFLEICRFK